MENRQRAPTATLRFKTDPISFPFFRSLPEPKKEKAPADGCPSSDAFVRDGARKAPLNFVQVAIDPLKRRIRPSTPECLSRFFCIAIGI
jgi:hypothetical protein